MAVTAVTPKVLVKGTISADYIPTALTAINAADTMTILYPQEGKLLLIINQTAADTKTVTIAAGAGINSVLGAYTFTAPQNDVLYLMVESSRFKSFAGVITLSFAASSTGFVGALAIP